MLYMPRSRPRAGPRSALARRICAAVLTLGVLLAALGEAGFASTFDIRKVEPSVYKIYAVRKKGWGTGTGFLVNGRRTLVTNFHVVVDGEKYFVGYRDGTEGRIVEARVVDRRPGVDLAVIETYEDLPGRALTLADFEPEKLTNVVAVGFPGAADVKQDTTVRNLQEMYARIKEPSGLDSTVTPGMVSRIYSASNTALSETQVINARTVQHNASINPGNSGGPLFDECGTVIGVNSFTPKNAQGLFFSIHSGEVIRLLRELNIAYAAVGHACLAASLSSGGGLLLPLIIGMAALLAIVAVVFAWRGGAAVSAVSRRLTGVRGKGSPEEHEATHDPAARRHEPGADRGGPVAAAGGRRQDIRARGGAHGRRRPGAAVRDHDRRRHCFLQSRPPRGQLEGPTRHGDRSAILERHLHQWQAHQQRAGPGRRCAAVRQRRLQADGGR